LKTLKWTLLDLRVRLLCLQLRQRNRQHPALLGTAQTTLLAASFVMRAGFWYSLAKAFPGPMLSTIHK
jgi:hypothetical protein